MKSLRLEFPSTVNEDPGAGSELALAEVLALCYRYEGGFYTFQCGPQLINARFITAYLDTACYQPVNGYRIELVASADAVADGVCVITDIKGHAVNAVVTTMRGTEANLISIEAVAF